MNEEAEMELASLVKELDYRITDALGNEASEKETAAALRTEITGITNDSRQVSSGKLFFCIPGANSDGHDFAQTLSRGMSTLHPQGRRSLSL